MNHKGGFTTKHDLQYKQHFNAAPSFSLGYMEKKITIFKIRMKILIRSQRDRRTDTKILTGILSDTIY